MTKKMTGISLLLALIIVTVSCNQDKATGTTDKQYSIFKILNGVPFKDDYPIFVKAKEMTGVTLIGSASQSETNEQQAFSLMQTGDLPDIISFTDAAELDNLGAQGALIPLEDLIKEYAPNIQAYLDSSPEALYAARTLDGHIYQVPFYQPPELQLAQGLYIRQDWLDKLNLATPTTVEELETVLVAFKEQDPNGNGLADEIPLFKRGASAYPILEILIDLLNATVTFDVDDQGNVIYGPAQENYKTAIKTLQRWYQMGLLDPEIFTRGTKSRDYMLNNDIGGATVDWFGSTGNYNAQLADKIEGFNFKAILPPSTNGEVRTVLSRGNVNGGWGISATAADPQGIMEYFDFWFSTEGRRLWNFGIENEDWTMGEDGIPQFTDKVLADPEKGALQVLRNEGHIDYIGVVVDPNYEFGWMSEVGSTGMKLYFDNNVLDAFPRLKFSTEDQKTFAQLNISLRNYVLTQSQQWLLSGTDVDSTWDAYLQGLEDQDLAALLAVTSKGYANFKNVK